MDKFDVAGVMLVCRQVYRQSSIRELERDREKQEPGTQRHKPEGNRQSQPMQRELRCDR
jgi:hypothetical protein